MSCITTNITIIPSLKIECSEICKVGSWDEEYNRLHDINGLELYTKDDDSLYAKQI